LELNTYMEATSAMPLNAAYFIAMRRAEAATLRGDIKRAQDWLSIAERHMALAERYDRGRMKREKQIAWKAELPTRHQMLAERAVRRR
jgi:hypothetical protein